LNECLLTHEEINESFDPTELKSRNKEGMSKTSKEKLLRVTTSNISN